MHPSPSNALSGLRWHALASPCRLPVGLALTACAWWLAWLGPAPFSEHTFFPLWLGYILTVDGWTFRRTGTSLLAANRGAFALLFVFSIPLWWVFEFANRFLGNWRYLMPRQYDGVTYALLASLAFSTVMPAIFVTAELLRTFAPFAGTRCWLRLDPGRSGLVATSIAGAAMFAAALLWPRYLFPLVWIGLFLFLDPLNAVLGNPSLTAQVRLGRWDSVLALCAAGLVCGGFWEMWNVFSMPKWVYDVPFVGRPRLFEMPLLGYGGYLPFALEVFAVWSLLQGIARPGDDRWPGFLAASGDSRRRGAGEAR